MSTSKEYSQYTTRLLCSDPDSSAAICFQERSSKNRAQFDYQIVGIKHTGTESQYHCTNALSSTESKE